MTGWQFQYWNGSAWVNLANAQIDHILEELSSIGGQEELVFDLPNTAANRTIVQALPYVRCLFNGTLIFPLANQNAVVAGLQYSTATIEVTAYNVVFAKLSQASSTVTQTYTNTAVATIAAYICGLAGVKVGSMPSLNVSIKFTNANCYKALQDLANACGSDYWADSNGFNIGTRDSTVQTLGYVGSNSKRGLDYSKQIDQVIVKGVDVNGNPIQGSAGSSGSIATFTEKKAADTATLNKIAAFKLQTLNNPSNGNSLECLISQVSTWHPGQYVSANRPDLNLVGSYIIQRITKQAVSCTVEVDAAMPQIDVNLQETDDFGGDQGDMAAYPISTSQLVGPIPTSNLSGSLSGFGVMSQGIDSAKPAAGVAGRIYWAVDTNKIYLDTGSTWQFIGSSVLGTLTGTISTGVLTGSLTGFATMSQGLDASKPSAGVAGRIYYATDTGKAYLDTGSTWVLTGSPLLGNINGTISASQIAANAVTANALAANAVTASAIAAGSISSSHLSAGCVTANALAAGAVTATAIAANTITAAQMTTAMMTGLTIQTLPWSDSNGYHYVLMGNYPDLDNSNNYNLAVVGEQLRFYTPTGSGYTNTSNLHAMGVITASSTTFQIGITGSYPSGILQLNSGSSGQIKFAAGTINFNNLPFSNYLGSLGSGSPLSSTFLRGDGTWATPASSTFNGGTITNSFYVSYSGTNRLWCSGNWSVYTLYLSASSSSAYPLAIGDTSNDWPPISWFDAYGSLYLGSLLRIGPRGTGANNTGYPEIFCRTDSVSGCTIQFGASGQRLDVVDYAWTVDLLLLDQSGNMIVSNSVTATGYGRLGSVGFENGWGSIWSDCSTSMSIIAIDSSSSGMMIVGSYIGGTRKIGMWDFVQVNGNMNVTSQCEASNFWVSGSWLNSSSTLYIGGSSGAAVTTYMNGNVNPINDNAYGLGSGSNRWAGISCVTAYVAGSVEVLGTSYSNSLFGNAFWGTGNGGIQWYDGAFNIMTNGNWFYYRGTWGGGAVFSIDSSGDVSCNGSLSCGAINAGGNILPKSGGSYYCGSYSYPWQIVDTQYLYVNTINSLTTGITIYGGSGSCGTSSSYWNYVYSAYIYYIHAPSAFNELLHDEFNEKINFDLIRNIKLKGDTIDPDCIKHLKNKDGFFESSVMDGWHLCVQQLIVKKLDEQEIISDELREELDKARAKIDELQLRIDELTLKMGGD
jgi:hypothetical protein